MLENFNEFAEFEDLLNPTVLKEIEEAKNNRRFEKLPANEYRSKVEELGLVPSKQDGKPMVKLVLVIDDPSSKYNNRKIFKNFPLIDKKGMLNGFLYDTANTVLNNLAADDFFIEITTFKEYGEKIATIFEYAKEQVYLVKVSYQVNKNDPNNEYMNLEVVERYD